MFRYLNGMDDKIKCKCCKSENTIKKGYRKTEKRGKIQKYLCLDCGKYFTKDEGFYRMRNSEKIITMSIDIYLSNLSSRKMRNQLERHLETKISHVSILDWVRRYTLKVQRYVDTLSPKLSGKVYADETEIDCEKRNDVFWCSVDWDTRYINATLYSSNSQNVKDATNFMNKIKKSVLPKYVQTDAAKFYPRAFRKVFYSIYKENNNVKHIINNVRKSKKHNVRIETVFSKIKDRVYDFRGIKALWSAPILMAGIVLQHNYIEKHTTTGQLPSELAGIPNNQGVNKWLEMIRLATFNQT